MNPPVPVLCEDNHLLLVCKPPNMPVQADISGDADLLSVLKAYIKEKYNKPGNVYLALVHRLDRPVGGAMVFCRTEKAASRVSKAIREGRLEKEYMAVVSGSPPGGALRDFLLKDGRTNMVSVVRQGTPGALEARLDYSPVATAGGLTLVRVRLGTGRPHQIRVQLAHAGCPIWGDNRYGAGVPGQQIALWSYRLALPHPITGETVEVICPPPAQKEPWRRFDWA